MRGVQFTSSGYSFMYKRRHLIEVRVAHHLGLLSPSECHVADVKTWMNGSFNLCIPVTIGHSKRVIIRFPLPYRVGDDFRPGNGDEKVRCEAATYACMRESVQTSQFLISMDLLYRPANVYEFVLASGYAVPFVPSNGAVAKEAGGVEWGGVIPLCEQSTQIDHPDFSPLSSEGCFNRPSSLLAPVHT